MTTRLVLCGSGEFTPAMDDVDRELLSELGTRPRVAIVPTAAGSGGDAGDLDADRIYFSGGDPGYLVEIWSRVVPAGTRLLGIDEDTALIARDAVWTVRGRGRVHVLEGRDRVAVAPGASLDGLLPAPLAYTQTP